jgi:dipeptidyl aminopeptidase/acylaminoacyl peptidase
MVIVDVATSAVLPLGPVGGILYSSTSAAWSPDEKAIAYLASSPLATYTLSVMSLVDHSKKEISRSIKPSDWPWLQWDSHSHTFLFLSNGMGIERRPTGLYSLPEEGGEATRLTASAEKVDDCDVISKASIACVRQAVSMPPGPVLVRIDDGTARSVGQINPELGSIQLEPVRELHWKNHFGDETSGFLIMPRQRSVATRVPLVLIGYAFDGEFVTQASRTLPTYPAQALARDGIAVLLFNYPRVENWEGPNFERGSRALGYGPLSSMQAIIEQLDAEGLIDPLRVGMMGHSLAGFWAQLAITQTELFSAVEMNNGGTLSEPGTYWITGTKQSRELQELVMGGPPYGDTLKNYLQFSFTLNASRIRAPVLMEYDSMESIEAMEKYEAMQHYHVPVEFFVYPNDSHVTERPEHRFMSLQRNLDWFEFWLLGKENVGPSKSDQYARWRQLRVLAREKQR